ILITDNYLLSLHDAIPIFAFSLRGHFGVAITVGKKTYCFETIHYYQYMYTFQYKYSAFLIVILMDGLQRKYLIIYALTTAITVKDRKSTRLNSSHQIISYA